MPVFEPGAWRMPCRPNLTNEDTDYRYPVFFNRIMKNLECVEDIAELCKNGIDVPTIVLTRTEYSNLWHTTLEWYNIHQLLNEILTPKLTNVELLWLDGHAHGNLDEAWTVFFGGQVTLRRFHQLDRSKPRCMRTTYFAPGGYTSALWHTIMTDAKRIGCLGTDPVRRFGRHFYEAFGVREPLSGIPLMQHAPIVTFLLRRRYLAHPRSKQAEDDSGRQAREIGNEAELALRAGLDAHSKDHGYEIRWPALEKMTFAEQVRNLSVTDVLVGVHGAGLTHILWLPNENTRMLELGPVLGEHYEYVSYLTGRGYMREPLENEGKREPALLGSLILEQVKHWKANVAPRLAGPQVVGCFLDKNKEGERDVAPKGFKGSGFSIARCHAECRLTGSPIFALQWDGECRCADRSGSCDWGPCSYGRYGRAPACIWTGPIFGGVLTNVVFEVSPQRWTCVVGAACVVKAEGAASAGEDVGVWLAAVADADCKPLKRVQGLKSTGPFPLSTEPGTYVIGTPEGGRNGAKVGKPYLLCWGRSDIQQQRFQLGTLVFTREHECAGGKPCILPSPEICDGRGDLHVVANGICGDGVKGSGEPVELLHPSLQEAGCSLGVVESPSRLVICSGETGVEVARVRIIGVHLRYYPFGCFHDSKDDRDLPEFVGTFTLLACSILCKSKNYTHMGMQYEQECWCGSSPGRHGRSDKCHWEGPNYGINVNAIWTLVPKMIECEIGVPCNVSVTGEGLGPHNLLWVADNCVEFAPTLPISGLASAQRWQRPVGENYDEYHLGILHTENAADSKGYEICWSHKVDSLEIRPDFQVSLGQLRFVARWSAR
eukprot:gnl/MRDRNA2_/MRDRNA2_187185_c0_seq1.p1 gnl/MRDRNA2_/MRDRNA2_187185_c0~~gnl/MRDRNA2_/MRDRNA2_187185_c0_seq1.p1  ORF type:complete len:829 (+),score=96.37 gnl/MRDRNA2_/MRDRNA2_187185_c0_seq1:101-2587(+)